MTDPSGSEATGPDAWQVGTITAIVPQTPTVRAYRIALPDWVAHLPGQHYDVRLTAPDGYTAQRSYSVSSSPLDVGEVELMVEAVPDGEVSWWFHEVARVGDVVELRGPLTTWFAWRGESPVLLVAGGSGVVPLLAMLRHCRRTDATATMRLVWSVRTGDDVIAADELGPDTVVTFTRRPPAGWTGATGRLDAELVARAGIDPHAPDALAFVCGSNGFVETATGALATLGWAPDRVRTERFGPSG